MRGWTWSIIVPCAYVGRIIVSSSFYFLRVTYTACWDWYEEYIDLSVTDSVYLNILPESTHNVGLTLSLSALKPAKHQSLTTVLVTKRRTPSWFLSRHVCLASYTTFCVYTVVESKIQGCGVRQNPWLACSHILDAFVSCKHFLCISLSWFPTTLYGRFCGQPCFQEGKVEL